MARMYPEHPQYCDFKSEQERALYHELRHQLPETVSVLHGLSVHVHPDPRHELDIEIDFLVVDPERGLLVLEVKGGGVHRDGRTGQWYTVDDAGQRHPIDDPFAQARKNRYALQSFLETAAKTRPFTFPIRYAVALPDVTVGTAYLGPWAPDEGVLDGPALRNLPAAVARALGGAPAGTRIGPYALDALLETLSPTVEVTRPSLGWRIRQTERQIIELTEEQYRILKVLERQRRVAVSGCAGSGKTMLAVQKARQLAHRGARVLLTCYNQHLAHWLRSNFVPPEDYGWPGEETPYHAVVAHYHEVARELCARAGIPFDPPASDLGKRWFYEHEAPELMLQALECSPVRFDAVVVDEGQDFQEEWWVTLDAALADRERGVLYVFYDDNQLLYTDRVCIPIDGEPYVLPENVRNTQRIHRAFLPYYRGEVLPECRGPEGPEVERVPVTPSGLLQALREILKRLVEVEGVPTEDIVVLTPIVQESRLREGVRVDKWTLTRDRTRLQPGYVRVSTIHAFKGLESPVVILAELDKAHRERAVELAYIALSRARAHLVVLGELPPAPPPGAPLGPVTVAEREEDGAAGA